MGGKQILFDFRRLFACLCGGFLLVGVASAVDDINPRTLCPKGGSKTQTILLIDTSDVLPTVAQARLEELLKNFYNPDTENYIKQGGELIVYRIASEVSDMGAPINACSPGNPKDRTWTDNLFTGKYDQLRQWRRFLKRIKQALPKPDEQIAQSGSPLLESIAVVAAKHIPNIGTGKNRKPTRLILFSDMMQHSKNLSHYKTLPGMAQFKTLRGFAEMDSKLSDVEVRLFYIRRTGLESKQTRDHYYWWTQVIEQAGGIILEQRLL